jgi:hypothetical protein
MKGWIVRGYKQKANRLAVEEPYRAEPLYLTQLLKEIQKAVKAGCVEFHIIARGNNRGRES